MHCIENGQDRRTRQDRRTKGWPLAHDLLAAIEHQEIEVLYQPLFRAADGGLIGAEALARWNHPRAGSLGGGTLFATAERAGHVVRLSRQIARTALSVAARWPEPLRLSLNFTAADLAADDFPDAIAALAAVAGFPAERLTLEITEQTLVADMTGTAERLRRLAGLGMRIALDDFGAGFSNFRYLKRLPLDALKLDRSMIEGSDEDPRDLAVLRGIVSMAQALGLEVVAEGIERESQREAAIREGCTAWQGFLGGAPMTAEAFARLTR